MSLRDRAAADLPVLFEADGEYVTVTDQSNASAVIKAITQDIGYLLDPETGQGFASRRASVALPMAALRAAGMGDPVGTSDTSRRPWVVAVTDSDGTVRRFKVTESHPDDTIGLVTCLLEAFE